MRLTFDDRAGPQDLFEKLADTQFNLLLMAQSVPPAGAVDFGDLLHTHPIPDTDENDAELQRVRIAGPAFYLLRPDGHVGLCGSRLDANAVSRYLAERVHLHDTAVSAGERAAMLTSARA